MRGGVRLQWSLQLCLKGLGNPSFFSGRYTKGPLKKRSTSGQKGRASVWDKGVGFVTSSHSSLPLSAYIKVPGNCRALLPLP